MQLTFTQSHLPSSFTSSGHTSQISGFFISLRFLLLVPSRSKSSIPNPRRKAHATLLVPSPHPKKNKNRAIKAIRKLNGIDEDGLSGFGPLSVLVPVPVDVGLALPAEDWMAIASEHDLNRSPHGRWEQEQDVRGCAGVLRRV